MTKVEVSSFVFWTCLAALQPWSPLW